MIDNSSLVKSEATKAVLEILEDLLRDLGEEVHREDHLILNRYAQIVVTAAARGGPPDAGENVERWALWKLGKMDGMGEDMELLRLSCVWLSNRDREIVKALMLIDENPAPGDDPLAGQRDEDLRALAAGEISIRQFRRRAKTWPTD
jgi:hypothetical protein